MFPLPSNDTVRRPLTLKSNADTVRYSRTESLADVTLPYGDEFKTPAAGQVHMGRPWTRMLQPGYYDTFSTRRDRAANEQPPEEAWRQNNNHASMYSRDDMTIRTPNRASSKYNF